MEVIATLQSERAARRVLEELAVGWRVADRIEGGLVYQKGTEEMLVVREDDRIWKVIKRRKGE